MASGGINMHPFAAAGLVAFKPHVPSLQSKEGVVFTHPNIIAGMKSRASLTNNYVPRYDFLTAKFLHPEVFGVGIAAISRGSCCLFGGPAPEKHVQSPGCFSSSRIYIST